MSTPSREHHPDPQNLHIPFQVPKRGRCTVDITLQPDPDPELHGQDLIGLYKDANVVKGFPVIEAKVSSPHSRTYAAICGWIQVTNTPGEPWVMDTYPLFTDLNIPYAFWGAEPCLVDAPGREGVQNYDWTARSFLCYSPDAVMTKRVVPILGVEWGWWIDDECNPYVKRLYQVDGNVWNEHLGLFREKYSEWTFDEFV